MVLVNEKVLTFILGTEIYGLPIQNVKEIIGIMDITPVPQTQNFIKGVINLRGKIISVLDLRLRFNMPSIDYNNKTNIILVESVIANNRKIYGLIVDTISEVLNIQTDKAEQKNEPTIEEEFIWDIIKHNNKTIIMLSVDKIINYKGITQK